MKKLILSAALGFACVSVMAQGTLVFANYAGSSIRAQVFSDPSMTTPISGAGYMADLYWASGAGKDMSSLAALSSPATFSTAGPGYFLGGNRTIAGAAAGSTITAQVRVWAVSAGATWDAAYAYGQAHSTESVVGWSGTFDVVLGGFGDPPGPATPLNGLGATTFSLVPVPEPTTLALAGLGAAALLIFRRRK